MTDPRPVVQAQALKTQKKKRKFGTLFRGVPTRDKRFLVALTHEIGGSLHRAGEQWSAGPFRIRRLSGGVWSVTEMGRHGSCVGADHLELAAWILERVALRMLRQSKRGL